MADYTMMLKDLFTPNRFGHSYFTRAQVESWFMDYELSDYLTPEQITEILQKELNVKSSEEKNNDNK